MSQSLNYLYFFMIHSVRRKLFREVTYLIPFIAGEWAVNKGNWEWKKKGLLYNLQVSQELLNSITTHSILCDSGAINRSQKKRWMTSLSHLFFFMADGKLDAERGLSSAHCLSLSLIRKQQVGSQEQENDTSPPPLWVMLWSSAHYCWYTHAHRHTMNTHIQTHLTHTHTHAPTHASIIFKQK